MTDYERACREWMRGCSCAPEGEPWKCEDCTAAFHERLRAIAEETRDGEYVVRPMGAEAYFVRTRP